ncbi:MAG TPA: hypothetical protein ACFYD2_03935 [Candidatus Avalokitesvara rifleensis]|uniref:hypothetical protein n=1 Tax=Candidatus Avalokitesvara rifleensis TaxID=3367620 RepID=UPI002712AF70|nr:hypothetical protein [Candidatus Brocadiales bacterium]
MKAFIGHSFDHKDSELVNELEKFLESAGVTCETGERAQNKSVAAKVKERILNNDIFVGIFTCAEEISLPESEHGKGLKAYTTSNWVIQEGGFAIGKEKELILLVENGVYNFPELQGDLELIFFDRDSFSKSFLRVNEIVSSIKGWKVGGVSGAEAQERKEDLKTPGVGEETKEKKDEARIKWAKAVFGEKDLKKAKQIYESELEQTLTEEEKTRWRAIALRHYHRLGDEEAFRELLNHVDENIKNPNVLEQLASRYKEMGEYKKAKDTFLTVRDLYDPNKEDDKEKIIDCYKLASLCLAHDNRLDEAINLLSTPLHENALKEYKGKVLAGLAEVAKEGKDNERFFIYAEGALDIDPSDTGLRFDLAYRYREEGHNKLSLLHYKKLTSTTKSPSGLNNMGVQYDNLKLPAKSIESYLKSADCNETLAMANIAQRYLHGGFVVNAQEQIDRANKLAVQGVKVHGNVGNAQSTLDNIVEDEETKEKEILIEAEKERKFRVKYSECFLCEKSVDKGKLTGIWETPWDEVNLTLDEKGAFFGDGEKREKIEYKAGSQIGALLSGYSEKQAEQYETKRIRVDGTIERMSGKYKIKVEKEGGRGGLLSQREACEANGYMIINEDYNTIDVMEKDAEEKIKIHAWKKK